ncbi:MAG: MurR/RpiR family transcriptional regulator [Pseudomonadota bacterium]
MPGRVTSAPYSVDQLGDVLAAVRAGVAPVKLGKRSLAVIDALINDPPYAANGSISSLAADQGVNASTLSRLARTLGYENFAEFQDVFKRHVHNTGHYYSEQAERLRVVQPAELSAIALTQRIAEREQRNIDSMLAGIVPDTLSAVVDVLATAPRVRIYGMRQANAAAVSLSYTLGLVRDDVSQLNTAEHGIAHGLAPMQPGDALVCFGFRPYSRNTLMAAHTAHKKRLHMVAITDRADSPLAATASHCLVAPTSDAGFSNGLAAAIVLAESLSQRVAQVLGDSALTKLKIHESLIADLHVEA